MEKLRDEISNESKNWAVYYLPWGYIKTNGDTSHNPAHAFLFPTLAHAEQYAKELGAKVEIRHLTYEEIHKWDYFREYGCEIQKQLGENRSQGRKTYHAIHLETNTPICIKEFRFGEGHGWDGYRAIEKEEAVLKRLNHPKIPAYLGRFETERSVCLRQNYVDAASLQGCLVNPARGKEIALELLSILDYAHSLGILHNDIKPSNIIGGNSGPYLVDFGAGCEKIGTGTVGVSTMLAGTPGYTPPERLLQRKALPCSDLYSLGVTMAVLMSKIPNFDITQYIDHQFNIDFGTVLRYEVSWQFRDWLKKMTHPDYRQRY